MRVTRTVILRLLVETDRQPALRGVLQVVGDDEQHPFINEQSLLVLLRHALRTGMPAASEGEYDENSLQVDLHP